MKYVKILFTILLTIMLVPNIVLAEGNSVTLTFPQTASKNEEIAVGIVLNSEMSVNEFKATISYETTALEILSIESKDGWKQDNSFSKDSPLSLDFSHDNGLVGKTTIATLKFKVKSDVAKSNTVITIEGTTKNKDDETINTLEKYSAKIDIKSTDNTLKDIKVNGETVTNFSPTTYEYAMRVDPSVTTINLEATLNDKTAVFKDKYGPRQGLSLDYGENTFELIVVSATKEERKYVIKITREDNRGTNNDLKSLNILDLNNDLFVFDPNTLLYTITTHKLETIDIEAVPVDLNATVKIDKPEKLAIGRNEIKIIVTSEKKEEKVYTVIINNLDTDVDTTLRDIELYNCDEDLKFEVDKYDYEIMYKEKYKDTLVIKPIVNNEEDAIATIDKDISEIGPNSKITIIVKAKDGTKNVERYYTIKFKKDTRVNFFLILGIIIFIVLLVIFIKLLIQNRKSKQKINTEEKNLEKTKRLEKINLE